MTQTTETHRIDIGDSGHVHGLSLTVTRVEAGMADAVDSRGKEWVLMPAHDAAGGWSVSGTSPSARIRGRVWLRDHTLTSVRAS